MLSKSTEKNCEIQYYKVKYLYSVLCLFHIDVTVWRQVSISLAFLIWCFICSVLVSLIPAHPSHQFHASDPTLNVPLCC